MPHDRKDRLTRTNQTETTLPLRKGLPLIMLRSALLVLSGNAAASLLLLARNLIVARLIPVADYGVASTFAVAMAVVEMMSALGLQQQIVQAKNGEDPRFQAALQGFQLLRGVISGTVLLAIAGPMAGFLGIPDATWAYQWLALVPILNALVHFDIYRLNRQMRFWPLMLTGGVPALLSLLAVWPLAHWFGDWQVMLYAILLQAAVTAITSHLVAERRWQVVFDRAIMAESLRFGWPLLVNGILLFAVFNGEKLIVGRELGMEALAIFAMGVTLTLTPTLVMAKTVQNLMLPRLSSAMDDQPAFQRQAALTFESILFLGVLFAVAVLLVGPMVTQVLLGSRYALLFPLIFLFALHQTLRVFKAAPALIALARGTTTNAMIANLVRVAALPFCWRVAATSGDILSILWIIIVAEIASYAVALALLPRVVTMASLLPHFTVGLLLLLCVARAMTASTVIAPWPVWVAAVAGLALCLAAMPEFRTDVRRRIGKDSISGKITR
jgi:O-antigen/teichoic acid export membrane protein